MNCKIVLAAIAGFGLAQGQNAGPGFKNLTHLKDTPPEQILPAMQVMSAALGVECTFCHVQGKMEADDKDHKKIARDMIAMTAALNKNSFNGRQDVTCFTCHRGENHPNGTPNVQDAFVPPSFVPKLAAAAGQPPTAEDILNRYITGLGGEAAIRKVTSRVMKGDLEAGGVNTPIEIVTKAPNKRVTISQSSNGGSYTAFDGTAGWMGNTGRPARAMSPAESWASSLDAEFYLGLRLKEMFAQLRPGRPAMVNGFECDTLTATSPERPPVRFFFDKSTGLLMRAIRYAATPVGRNPTQIDYSDYRAVDGVKVPFRWTLSRPNGRFAIQVATVASNAPVEDDRFAKPAGPLK